MNQVKKAKGKIKFSKLRLRPSPSKSKFLNSLRPNEKISSYFSSVLNETVPNSQLQNDTPKPENEKSNYLLSTAQDDDDEHDFKESTTQKPTQMLEMKNRKIVNNAKKARSRKAVLTFGKNIIMDPSCHDTNPEHLQLAIAMSKSVDEIENPNSNSVAMDNIYPSTQEKVTKIKQTLHQYGFKSNIPVTDLPAKSTRRQNARNKFKHITPTLYLRTDEDRTKMIEQKVSEIIQNITIYYENMSKNCPEVPSEVENICNKPNSFVLRDYYNEDAVLFRKNQLSISEMSQKIFYNNIVAPSNTKVGVLLKDWSSVPGREKTPPLLDEKEEQNSKISEKNCVGPGQSKEILLSRNTNPHDSSWRKQPLESDDTSVYVNNQRPSPNFSGIIFPENSNNLNNMETSPKSSNLLNGTLEDSQEYVTTRKSRFESNDKSVLNNICELHIPAFINRSISPDLFSDNEADADVVVDENDMSPQLKDEDNSQYIFPRICSVVADSSCDTMLLSPKKIKTESWPEVVEKNKNVSNPLRETSEDGTFSDDTQILSLPKNDKTTFENMFSSNSSNCSCDTEVNNISSSSSQEIYSAGSSRDTVLWNGNKNSSPIPNNNSNASSNFSNETKLLSDYSEPNSVSLIEITPPKNKVKASRKSSQSESVSLLNISPLKNNGSKSEISFSAARRKLLSDFTIIKSTVNSDENDASSRTSKTTELFKKSPISNKLNINVSGENSIHHFESFCDNSNNCFDLTQLSDDSEDVELNSVTTESKMQNISQNKSTLSKNNLICQLNDDEDDFITTTQLTNSYLNENDAADLIMSPKDSIKMTDKIKTNKLTEECYLHVNTKSNAADNENKCLGTTKNEQIYNNIDKTFVLSSDTDDETDSSKNKLLKEICSNEKESVIYSTSPSEFCYNKIYDEDINIVSFLGHINRKEISMHELYERKTSKSCEISNEKDPTNIGNLYSPKSSKNNNLVLDKTINAEKTKSKTLRRFFSDNMIPDREFEAGEKSFLSQSRQNKTIFNKVVNNSDKNESSFRRIKDENAANLNESMENIIISDDEIKYLWDKPQFKNGKNHLSLPENEYFSRSCENVEINDEKLNCPSITSTSFNNSFRKEGNRDNEVDDVDVGSQHLVNEPKNSQYLLESPIKKKDDIQFVNIADINTEELNDSSTISHKIKEIKKHVEDTLEKNTYEVANAVEANVIDFNDLPCNAYQYSDSLFDVCSRELSSTPKCTKKTSSVSHTQYSQTLKHPRVSDLSSPTANKVHKSITYLNDSINSDLRNLGIGDNVEDLNNHKIVEVKTPENANHRNQQIITPNSEIIVKTNNVTPIPNYNVLNTPQRNKELAKFGLKPMKKSKGVKILQYIYDATHPVLGNNPYNIRKSSSDDEKECIIKRRKICSMEGSSEAGLSNNDMRIKRKSTNNPEINANDIIVGNKIAESESLKDMIFERVFSTKIASCRLPLHIAWHNFVFSQQNVHKKILLYEPLDIKNVHQNFKSLGFKFHIQDLKAFLIRKCICIQNTDVIRKKKIRTLRKAK